MRLLRGLFFRSGKEVSDHLSDEKNLSFKDYFIFFFFLLIRFGRDDGRFNGVLKRVDLIEGGLLRGD